MSHPAHSCIATAPRRAAACAQGPGARLAPTRPAPPIRRAVRRLAARLGRCALVPLAGLWLAGCSGGSDALSAARPHMVLTPEAGTPLGFGEVVLGRTMAPTATITVGNSGAGPLVLRDVAITGTAAASFQVTGAPAEVEVGRTAKIFVGFVPPAAGATSAVLRLQSNDPVRPVVDYPVSGRAREPCQLELSPANTVLALGQTSTITLRAAGAAACTVVRLTTDAGLFPFMRAPSLPLAIQAHGAVGVPIRYARPSSDPGVPVRSVSASEADGRTVTVSVTGQPPEFNCLSAYPYRLLFEGTPPGGMARQKVTLSNSCSRDGSIRSGRATIGYYQFGVDPAQLPLRVPAGGTADLFITYTPFSAAGDNGTVVLETDDGGVPELTITLFGRAAVPSAAIFPTTLDFGEVAYQSPGVGGRSSCGSAAEFVHIASEGDWPLTVQRLSFEGDGDFEVADVLVGDQPISTPDQPFTVPPGLDAKVYLQFRPIRRAPAAHAGALVITHDGAPDPARVALTGTAVAGSTTADTFHQPAGPKVDLLFVIDDSCSMASKQAILLDNLSRFVGSAEAAGADYNIAVVDTEGFSPQAGDFQRTQCYPYPRVVNARWGDRTSRAAALECMFNLGTAGSGIEAGLASAKAALVKAQDPAQDPAGLDRGFLRDDARLAIVVVSDEDDQSHESQSVLRDYFLSLKGPRRHGDVRVHAIAGPVAGPCQIGQSLAEPGYNYFWMTQQTGGLFLDICQADWSPLLDHLDLDVFTPIATWALSQAADPATLQVAVSGRAVPLDAANGYTFDPGQNAVTFHGAAVPVAGSTVSVAYTGLCRP